MKIHVEFTPDEQAVWDAVADGLTDAQANAVDAKALRGLEAAGLVAREAGAYRRTLAGRAIALRMSAEALRKSDPDTHAAIRDSLKRCAEDKALHREIADTMGDLVDRLKQAAEGQS